MKLSRGVVLLTVVTLFSLLSVRTSSAQGRDWQADVDWSASNSDAGGSVDCPADYISQGVEYAIAAGGRAAVINEALFAAYKQDFDRAFSLVLITQCHNGDAYDGLLDAGEQNVVRYLVRNYTPTGIDPATVRQAGIAAIAALGGD